jgi:hypothetical protein
MTCSGSILPAGVTGCFGQTDAAGDLNVQAKKDVFGFFAIMIGTVLVGLLVFGDKKPKRRRA